MLHAVINAKAKRVEDILTQGDTLDVMAELIDLYNRHVDGQKVDSFDSIEEARERTITALTRSFYPESASSIEGIGPVARARLVFEEYKDRPRKDVIEACARLGIKRSTASTQYQRWRRDRLMIQASSH